MGSLFPSYPLPTIFAYLGYLVLTREPRSQTVSLSKADDGALVARYEEEHSTFLWGFIPTSFSSRVVWYRFQPVDQTPDKDQLRAGTTHTIASVTAAPALVPLDTRTIVTFTAQISDPRLIPNSVKLLRAGLGSGLPPTPDGEMQNTSGTAYTIQVPLYLTGLGQLQYHVSAAFKGASRRVVSSVVPVFAIAPPFGNFTVDSRAVASGGPLSFTNFGDVYAEGGVLPRDGATINVTNIPLPPQPLSNHIAVELAGATISSTTTVTVSRVSCTQVAYSDKVGHTVTYNRVAVYCPFENMVYTFSLTYHAGDSKASQYLSAFKNVWGSVKF